MPRAASLNFSLYRVTVSLPRQGNLYQQRPDREELLKDVLDESPSLESHNIQWHMGNVRKLDDHGYYFAVGRTSASRIEQWDADQRRFMDLDYESSPYTHAVIDTHLQIIALAAKSRVSQSIRAIANRLQRLIEDALIKRDDDIRATVDPIPDPVSFIKHIRTAHAVLGFTITFGLPNHFDADEQLQKPLQDYAQASNAEQGKLAIKGAALAPETLVSVTKSVAAAGHSAQVRYQASAGSGTTTRNLHDNPTTLSVVEADFHAKEVLDRVREEYAKIRSTDGAEKADDKH